MGNSENNSVKEPPSLLHCIKTHNQGVDMQAQDGGSKPSQEEIKQLLSARLQLAEQLINEDIENGVFTVEDANSFASLHEATDPNCYVSDEAEPASSMEKDLLKNYDVEDWINYWETLIEALDSWLRCGMEESAVKHLNDGTLGQRF